MQETWDNIERPNLRIRGKEELQLKRQKIYSKITEGNSRNLKMGILLKVPENYRIPNRLDQKKPLST